MTSNQEFVWKLWNIRFFYSLNCTVWPLKRLRSLTHLHLITGCTLYVAMSLLASLAWKVYGPKWLFSVQCKTFFKQIGNCQIYKNSKGKSKVDFVGFSWCYNWNLRLLQKWVSFHWAQYITAVLKGHQNRNSGHC